MLTGDKLETAKCIGVCTGFKSEYQSFFEIVSMDPAVIEDKLEDFDPTNHCLVITGSCLDIILNDKTLMASFLQNAKSAKSVILCRCAPKQKAQVARAVKEKYGKVVCCIGDGGNDVGMIQQANIGVGLQGKEGMQAALASDVSLVRFKDLEMLFLWHGRLSYLRTSKLSNFVVHRGLLITTIQALFVIIFYYVSINIYNGYLIMGFNTVFTNLPVFALILDQDIPLRQALNYPILYDHVQDGKQMNLRVFLTWTWKSIFQGAVILLLSILLLSKTFLEMVTITFTAIIFIGNPHLSSKFLYIFPHGHSSPLFASPNPRIPEHHLHDPDLAPVHHPLHRGVGAVLPGLSLLHEGLLPPLRALRPGLPAHLSAVHHRLAALPGLPDHPTHLLPQQNRYRHQRGQNAGPSCQEKEVQPAAHS